MSINMFLSGGLSLFLSFPDVAVTRSRSTMNRSTHLVGGSYQYKRRADLIPNLVQVVQATPPTRRKCYCVTGGPGPIVAGG